MSLSVGLHACVSNKIVISKVVSKVIVSTGKKHLQLTLAIRTLFITTMRYKDQVSGDKGSVCHCNIVLYNNNLNVFVIRTRKLGTEAVVIKRVYCTLPSDSGTRWESAVQTQEFQHDSS